MSLAGYLSGLALGRTGVTITAVDRRRNQAEHMDSVAGPLARYSHLIGAVPMTSAASMVHNVLGELGDDLLSRLNIIDHGNPEILMLGDDRVTLKTLSSYESVLGKLYGRFANDGFVHLQACQIGQNEQLLVKLAEIFGVPVVAGTGMGISAIWLNKGSLVVAYPTGGVSDSFDRWVGFFGEEPKTNGKKLLSTGSDTKALR